MSAEAASSAFELIKERLPKSDVGTSREFIIATVKGDIHDIGKNIVRVLLESYGFTVHDLGKDVPSEAICKCVERTGCKLVGLSALMTTTVPSMEETIRMIRDRFEDVTIIVGGAVLTKEYADLIGADFYAADAMETVRFSERFYSENL